MINNIIQINLPSLHILFFLKSVVLLRLPGPYRRLLCLVSRSVQLILYIHETVQDEE